MKTKATILTLLVLTVACAFTWPRKTTITPPGTYEVSENLYYDKDVMSNFDWLEYTHWLSRIYGKESVEYKAAQPNVDVWGEEFICLLQLRKYYANHKAYKDFPVVGITQKQAEDYLQWRSDRVMEYFLVSRKVIENMHDSTPETAFSTEKYFAGDYHGITPNKKYMQYPVYSLPTPEQHAQAMNGYSHFTATEPKVPCFFDSLRALPFNAVSNQASFSQPISIWTAKKDTIIGVNWRKPSEGDLSTSKKATNYIGLRAVCTWKTYVPEK